MSEENIWDSDIIPAQAAVDEDFYKLGSDSLLRTMRDLFKTLRLPKEVLNEHEPREVNG